MLRVPLARREKPFRFAVHADAAPLGEPERLGETVDTLDAHLLGELPKVDVARPNDGIVEVHPLVALVAAELLPADLQKARALHPLARVHDVVFERGQRGEHLERRAWEVRLVDRLVDERSEGVAGELVVAPRGQPAAHLVRVVDGLRVESANRTGVNVDHHGGARWMRTKRSVEGLHHRHVERELNVVTWNRLAKHLDFEGVRAGSVKRAPARIDHLATKPARAAKQVLVPLFEPVSADAVSRTIRIGVVGGFDVRGVDLVQVADEMCAERAVGIVAKRDGDDVERRKLRQMRLESGQLIAIDVAEELDLVVASGVGQRCDLGLERLDVPPSERPMSDAIFSRSSGSRRRGVA